MGRGGCFGPPAGFPGDKSLLGARGPGFGTDFVHSPAEYEKWLPRFGFKSQGVQLAPKDAAYPGRAAGWRA